MRMRLPLLEIFDYNLTYELIQHKDFLKLILRRESRWNRMKLRLLERQKYDYEVLFQEDFKYSDIRKYFFKF